MAEALPMCRDTDPSAGPGVASRDKAGKGEAPGNREPGRRGWLASSLLQKAPLGQGLALATLLWNPCAPQQEPRDLLVAGAGPLHRPSAAGRRGAFRCAQTYAGCSGLRGEDSNQ